MESAAVSEFRALFDEQFSYVWSAIRRLGVRPEDVEDLTHEVFLNVFRRFEEYDRSRPPRPWLFGFAVRVASVHRRKAHHRRERMGAEEVLTDPAPPADVQMSELENRSLLISALDTLDLDRRAVLVLHEWDHEPIPEVARALGIPVNTAYSRLRGARLDLAAAVKRLVARRGS